MRHLIALAAVAAALAVSSAAYGGGWATVGFTPLPDGVAAGEAWSPEITVLQHGRTPLGGLSPVLTIEEVASGESRSFTATETSELGVYETEVVFPSTGRWRIVVDSGFGDSRVTYGPVAIGGEAIADPRSLPVLPALAAAAALMLAAAGLLGARRARKLEPAGR